MGPASRSPGLSSPPIPAGAQRGGLPGADRTAAHGGGTLTPAGRSRASGATEGAARHPQPVPQSCVLGPSAGLPARSGAGGAAMRGELPLSSPAGVWAPLEMMKATGERSVAGCWHRLTRSSLRAAAPGWEPSRPAEGQLLLQMFSAGHTVRHLSWLPPRSSAAVHPQLPLYPAEGSPATQRGDQPRDTASRLPSSSPGQLTQGHRATQRGGDISHPSSPSDAASHPTGASPLRSLAEKLRDPVGLTPGSGRQRQQQRRRRIPRSGGSSGVPVPAPPPHGAAPPAGSPHRVPPRSAAAATSTLTPPPPPPPYNICGDGGQ